MKISWSELASKAIILIALLVFLLHSSTGTTCADNAPVRGTDADAIAAILQVHNQLRAQVARGEETQSSDGRGQPSATNMMELKWDNELAAQAQRLTDTCVFDHDSYDDRQTATFRYVGQNLGITFNSQKDTTVDWAAFVKEWYKEVKFFSRSNIYPFEYTSATGHYTQVVWAKTTHVGCGMTMYYEGGWWKQLFACDYGPAGNFGNQMMYEEGATASNCPNVRSGNYNGLCA